MRWQMDGDVMMVIAGASASGKSYLLEHALQNKLPLFGEEDDYCFQEFRFPAKRIPFTTLQIYRFKHVTAFRKLAGLRHMVIVPRYILVHLDLTALIGRNKGLHDDIRSADSILRIMSRDQGFRMFNRYKKVVINTVFTPWDIAVDRYASRTELTSAHLKQHEILIYYEPDGKIIYNAIYQAWRKLSRDFRSVKRFATSFSDGVFEIRPDFS